jgi:hypothetical protein
LSPLQAPFDEVDVRFERSNAGAGFLLEGVQHEDDIREPHRVHRPEGVAIEVVDDFKDTSSAKALERLGERCRAANLCVPERASYSALDILRERTQVGLAAPDPVEGFG